jgi:SPW repeat
MQILRVPSGLTILAGLILAASPWLLHFRRDHVAFLDVAVGRGDCGGRPRVVDDHPAEMAGPRLHSPR